MDRVARTEQEHACACRPHACPACAHRARLVQAFFLTRASNSGALANGVALWQIRQVASDQCTVGRWDADARPDTHVTRAVGY